MTAHHISDARMLRIAAIDEQIGLCEHELKRMQWLGDKYWWETIADNQKKLERGLIEKIKTKKLKGSVTSDVFERLRYKEYYEDLNEMIESTRKFLRIDDEKFDEYQAKAKEESEKLPDLSRDKKCEYATKTSTWGGSDSDEEG
jgi:hypothetical protein